MANKETITIDFKSNKKEVLSHFDRNKILALIAMGAIVSDYAMEDCPVDTGRLRNSITYATANFQSSGNENPQLAQATKEDMQQLSKPEADYVYIGTNVIYAAKQEFGDSFHHTTGKAHFLRDAAQNHVQELKKEAETIMKS